MIEGFFGWADEGAVVGDVVGEAVLLDLDDGVYPLLVAVSLRGSGAEGLGDVAGVAPARCYLADGALDPSFGGDGVVAAPSPEPGFGGNARPVTFTADGRILVGGRLGGDFEAIRYLDNGDLDASFGTGGISRVDFRNSHNGVSRYDFAQAMAVDGAGRIVLAGTRKDGPARFGVARLLPDGAIDTGFGENGRKLTDVGPASDYGESVAIDGQGRIVVGGEARGGMAVVRYLPSGTLDSTLSDDGKLITAEEQELYGAYDVAIDDTSRIVATGFSGLEDRDQFGRAVAVVRILAESIRD